MGDLVREWAWKRRTARGVTSAMVEPSYWTAGEEDGHFGVSGLVASELAARADAELSRARPKAPPERRTRLATRPAGDRLDRLMADYKAQLARDVRKRDLAEAVEAGMRAAASKAKKRSDEQEGEEDEEQDSEEEEDDEEGKDVEDELDEEDEEEEAGSEEDERLARQRKEAAAYVRASAGKASPFLIQIGATLSRKPSAATIAGHLAGCKNPHERVVPPEKRSPRGKSPLDERGRLRPLGDER
jgi:hypothetical protein